MYLISPTEPEQIQALGESSPIPEQLGCDVLWAGVDGLCGVQRKAVPDLIASVRDSRLGKELEQMQRLSFRALLIEGQTQWTTEGFLLGAHSSWSRKQHRGVILSAQSKGVLVLETRNHLDTLDTIQHMAELTNQKHRSASSMLYRGNGKPDGWGKLTDRATAVHFLSGIPGIGVELAGRIYDRFGKVPIVWGVSEEELLSVEGIGLKRVKQLMKVLA